MKRKLILCTLLAMLLVNPLAVASSLARTVYLLLMAQAECPGQQFLPLTGLDVNKVAIDPVTGNPLVFQRHDAYAGQSVKLEIHVCDRNIGDPNSRPQTLRAWHETPNGPVDLPIDPNGNSTVTVAYAKAGLQYETFGVTDGVGDPNSVRIGTVALRAWNANKLPELGCRIVGD